MKPQTADTLVETLLAGENPAPAARAKPRVRTVRDLLRRFGAITRRFDKQMGWAGENLLGGEYNAAEIENNKDASSDAMQLRDLLDIRDATPEQATFIEKIKALPDDDEYFYEEMQSLVYHVENGPAGYTE